MKSDISLVWFRKQVVNRGLILWGVKVEEITLIMFIRLFIRLLQPTSLSKGQEESLTQHLQEVVVKAETLAGVRLTCWSLSLQICEELLSVQVCLLTLSGVWALHLKTQQANHMQIVLEQTGVTTHKSFTYGSSFRNKPHDQQGYTAGYCAGGL